MNETSVHDPGAGRPALRGLSVEAMKALLEGAGFEGYRAGQLYHWIFARGAENFEEMRNLPKALLAWLGEHTVLDNMLLVRAPGSQHGQTRTDTDEHGRARTDTEGTRKVLFRLADGRHIESVIMRDEGAGRTSFCLSSQVGCALGCEFCLTGYGGFQRDLRVDEIVGQALAMRRRLMAEDEPLHHIVFMGMGEPLHNLEGVIPAIRLLGDPDGFGHSRRRITVSTAGVAPGMERLGREGLGLGLAVSLNATTDEVRTRIMPVNKKWPIAELVAAMKRFPIEPRRRITVEYVLLAGVNDTPEDARRLVGLLRGVRCKVNLIMFNPSPHLPFRPVEEAVLNHFAQTLSEAHTTVTVRWSKGREVEAACGQLAAHYFEKAAGTKNP